MTADKCTVHDVCEGGSLHIRGRDKKGCAQFQDGSWFTKNYDVCPGPHPGRAGAAEVVRTWLENELAKAWR